MTRSRRGLPVLPAPTAAPRRYMEAGMFDEATAREDLEKVIGTFSGRHFRTFHTGRVPSPLSVELTEQEAAS